MATSTLVTSENRPTTGPEVSISLAQSEKRWLGSSASSFCSSCRFLPLRPESRSMPTCCPASGRPRTRHGVAFHVKADCVTVLREASEDPLYNQPEFLGQVVWPSPTDDGPISSEYQSIEMYPCLTGSNETMEHVFLFQPWWTLGYSLPASVPLHATINVTIHGSDIRYFGPNPAQEVHWNVTILPAVDPAHSVARPDGGITVRNGKGAVLNVTGRLVANHDFDVRLEPRAETLDPYCVHPWQTSQWEPGPLVHVPRTAAEPEGTAFSAQAFRPPPKPPLRTEDGCTARGTMKAARSEERRVGKECRSRWSP